ncbi:pentapeptide repeat-containing protein [Nostoc sp. DedQUE07]|uniref:pentapeptide repeat-containing protein n=1 Tax=Nostoc sp. DedQUE07 TaxID=3075392 RepID=UPI002AD3B347|nr:pentapeptide repeat-containing protein [Nostoc sp. DedQUE07]MDZ8131949.1 pentapeptide repeat-containing protein [Nostoc sp. DedQUE07]
MEDPSPGRKNRKITYAASPEGKSKAERALRRLGFESKLNFAKSQLLARSTVTNFFQRKPIQLDSFKRICDALELNWREIALMPEEQLEQQLHKSDCSSSMVNQEVESRQIPYTQVTVIDKQTKTVKIEIRLKGHINSIDNLKILELVLREYSGNSIEITDIKEGSIRLFVEGSPEDIDRLVSCIKSGELKTVRGFPVEDVQISSENSNDESIKSDDKWRLIQEIVSQPVKMRRLSGVDLSDADLSGADLSNADLRGADLKGTDLRDADLSHANLSGADLSHANLSGANLSGVDLSDADLSHANLSGANQTLANLSDVILIVANLIVAILNGAIYAVLILSDANLIVTIGVVLIVSETTDVITNAILANLIVASMIGTNLTDANLRGANLTNAIVVNTFFEGNIGLTKNMRRDLERRGAIFGARLFFVSQFKIRTRT